MIVSLVFEVSPQPYQICCFMAVGNLLLSVDGDIWSAAAVTSKHATIVRRCRPCRYLSCCVSWCNLYTWRTAEPLRRVPFTMAGGMAVPAGKPGKRYNAKMTGYVWFLCFIGGSGGLLLGYDNGVIGTLSPPVSGTSWLRRPYGSCLAFITTLSCVTHGSTLV